MTYRLAPALAAVALAAPVAAAVSLSACAGGDMTMDEHLKILGNHLTAATADLDGHKGEVAAATDVAAINSLEGPHATKMANHFNSMGTMVSDIMGCTKNGAPPSTTAMTSAIMAMKNDCETHKSTLAAAANLADARAEEDRHQQLLAAKMATMTEQHSALMGATAGYTCSSMSH